eukprot:Phypoly_transcript_12356.p1 GENE.Phypoly_transcript_12356~~Phypoly_transcript_12356.p1  ORF type:complete len:347 (+),score=35.40 Phypoly_transcript_12356:42-1043(+)
MRCAACYTVWYCSKEHQKVDWPNHKLHCKKQPPQPVTTVCFEIKETPSKGKGLFATRDIKKGECIVSEFPLVKSEDVTSFNRAFLALSDAEKDILFSLHDTHSTDEHRSIAKALSIYRTNSVHLSDDVTTAPTIFGVSLDSESGLFPIFSRINHSCTPNSNHYFNPALGKETVHAVKDIAAGEEVTTTYIDLLSSRKQRRKILEQKFNFLCECPACSVPAAEQSDNRRTEANKLHKEIPDVARRNWRGVVKMVNRAVALLTEEGCAEIYTAGLYYDAYQVCAAGGQLKEAREFVGKALEAAKIYRGENSEIVRKYKVYVANPRQHPSWGLLAF